MPAFEIEKKWADIDGGHYERTTYTLKENREWFFVVVNGVVTRVQKNK